MDAKIMRHYSRIRCKSVDEIRFITKNSTHAERMHFVDYHVEALMKDFKGSNKSQWADQIKRMRRQAMKNDLILAKKVLEDKKKFSLSHGQKFEQRDTYKK